MIKLAAIGDREVTVRELGQKIIEDDVQANLRALTNEMVDTMLDLIEVCIDEDVTFVPDDPDAYDRYAATEQELEMPWTLGHVIVHTTASAEESAALAAELARGVEYHGRSRYEVPWQTVTTIAHCRQRLEESRRMRLASLDMWPDVPRFDNVYTPYKSVGRVGPVERFLLGLRHDADHLGQIEEIVRQASALRQVS
ncbi:MAG: DinB family protein [Chloroflexota bacterium]